MKRRTITKTIAVILSSGGTLYVNGAIQRGICTGWVARLVGHALPNGSAAAGAYNVTFRRGLVPSWGQYWRRGRLTKGRRWLYVHAAIDLLGVRPRGRVPRGPIGTVLRQLIGKSPEAVIWYKAEKIEVT